MECWNIGEDLPPTHYSTIPLFQYSNIPIFQPSSIPAILTQDDDEHGNHNREMGTASRVRCALADGADLRQGDARLQPAPAELRAALRLHRPVHLPGGGGVARSCRRTSAVPVSSVYQVSRMASVGQAIITAVLWFQFLTSQVIAIVMLSTSISDEIYKRTLGTLMTTPIGSFQIVIGKLASRLLQIVLLLAISLPLLAVVRVFGGVPWGSLLCGLCVTLTAVVFVGSLSLFFSIFTRRAYAAIIEAILATGILFLVLPMIAAATIARTPNVATQFRKVAAYVNPYIMIGFATESMVSARAPIWFLGRCTVPSSSGPRRCCCCWRWSSFVGPHCGRRWARRQKAEDGVVIFCLRSSALDPWPSAGW